MNLAIKRDNGLLPLVNQPNSNECMHQIINDGPELFNDFQKKEPLTGQAEDLKNHLFMIEDFVMKVLTRNDPGFIWRSRKTPGAIAIPTLLARAYYKHLSQQHELPTLELRFSEHIELYFTSAREIGFPSQMHGGPDTLMPAPDERVDERSLQEAKPCKRLGDLFNELIDKIRTVGRSTAFKEKLRKRKEDSARNFSSACSYIDLLFKAWSRMLVLRLELGYREELAQGITVEQARQDFQRLLNNRRHNKLFNTGIGYIWKLEEGIFRGPHFHVFIFLKGSASRHHMYLAEKIGEYWKNNITNGRGTFFNCNRKKYTYPVLGMIHNCETDLIDNLKHKAISYLTKQEQFPLIKSGRTFGKGEPPKLPDVKLGRPRVK
jgi:hypothetical protein